MIEQAKLGEHGPLVGRLGYGAMVLEGYYGASDDRSAVETLAHAIDMGMMIDSADAYGNGHNESLIAQALRATKSPAFVATKFGIVSDPQEKAIDVPTGWGFSLRLNSSAEYAKRALHASLKRLNVETIDLWYAHYLDTQTPIEETVSAMAQAVHEGKVRYIGLSNVSAEQVRRAHAIHPIAAVQYEYSLWRREAEIELLPTLRELGIALVGWSPLGSGFLTGTVKTLGEGDFRLNNPRYQGENFQTNQDRFAPVMALAQTFGITPAQLALAWLLHQGRDVFPIPGSRQMQRLDENAKAIELQLDPAVIARLNTIAPHGAAVGDTLL